METNATTVKLLEINMIEGQTKKQQITQVIWMFIDKTFSKFCSFCPCILVQGCQNTFAERKTEYTLNK